VAEALNCTLVYALVPNRPLEAQSVKRKDSEARLDEILRDTNPRLFWD